MNTTEEIMKEQFKRRNFKYRMFFIGLLLEKYIFKLDKLDNYNKRGLLLRNYYFLMRYLDDIIDGDITIKNYKSIDDRIKYLEEKLNNFIYKIPLKDNVDKMIFESHLLAHNIGFSLDKETELIINSLIFDGNRLASWYNKNELKILTKDELDKHFYDLDIIGTISGCLKIFDEELKYLNTLYYLGTSSRKYYDIRDFIEDIKNGLVNISLENIRKYNISENDINKVMILDNKFIDICKYKTFNNKNIRELLPNSILNFLIDSSKECEDKLNTYYSKINELSSLRNSTKLTLNLGYEKSIKRYLNLLK